MKIQTIAISELNPAAYNPRKDLKPGDIEYEKLKKSIAEFDMVEPLVWNKRTGNLVGGHQRLKILKEMDYSEVEVSVVDLSETKEKALNLALNKISGEWDFPRLKDILEELDTGAFDMEITGFDPKEIEDIMTQFHIPGEGLTDDDAVPEATESICKRGDLWSLGNHRLLCGDATVKADVEKLMGGEKADMVFTDPPYGIDLDTDWSGMKGSRKIREKVRHDLAGHKYKKVIGDDVPFDFNGVFNPECKEQFWFGADYYHNQLPDGGSWLVWDKRLTEEMDKVLGSPFEMIWSRVKHRKEIIRMIWAGVSGFQEDVKRRIHPTQKPLKLLSWIIEKYSKPNQTIYDPFGGSGSTLIACEKLDRRCFMMEIDEHYCDVIIKRWEDFTGKKAVRIDETNAETRDILS